MSRFRSLQVSAVVRLFLALWLAITPTFVWAGSMTLLGVGGGSAALPGPPTLTFNSEDDTTTGGQNQTTIGFTLPADGPDLVIVGVTSQAGLTVSSIGITPTTGTGSCSSGPISFTTGMTVALFYCTMTAANPGSTTVTLNYPSNPFTQSSVGIWTSPTSGFSSTSPIGGGSSTTVASNTVASVTIPSTSGGFCISTAADSAGSVTATWGSTFTYNASRYTHAGFGVTVAGSDTAGNSVTTQASATANVTWSGSGTVGIAAACWR